MLRILRFCISVFVIALALFTLAPIGRAAPMSLAAGKDITTNNHSVIPEYDVKKAFDGDSLSRYVAGNPVSGTYSPTWVQIDFKIPATYNTLDMKEFEGNITAFALQYSDDGQQWKTITARTKLTNPFFMLTRISFPQVTSRYLRLSITQAISNPKLYEADVYLDDTPVPISTNKKVSANAQISGYEAEKIVDGSVSTRWASDKNPGSLADAVWIQIDLEVPQEFNYYSFSEFEPRILEYYIQYSDDGSTWEEAVHNKYAAGSHSSVSEGAFKAVKARYARLLIVSASNGPTIWEFELSMKKGEPKATNVKIEKTDLLTKSLKAGYIYSQSDGSLESGSIYRWYAANTEEGPYSEIKGENGTEYTLKAADSGKYFKFEVIPCSAAEPTKGSAVVSLPVRAPEQYLNGALVMYAGNPAVLTDRERKKLDAANEKVFPFIKDGKIYVPLRYAAEALGAQVDWAEGSLTVRNHGRDTYLVTEDDDLKEVGKYIYIEIERLGKILDQYVYKNSQGLMILSSKKEILQLDDVAAENLTNLLLYLYDTAELERIAQSLFMLIDLSKPELAQIQQAYKSKAYGKALELFKDRFIDIAGTKYVSMPEPWVQYTAIEDIMNNFVSMNHPSGKSRNNIGEPGHIQWFMRPPKNYPGWGVHLSSMHFPYILIDTFLKTGDKKYMEKWAAIWDDFATNNFDMWLDTMNSKEAQYNDSLPVVWAQQLYLTWKLENFTKQFGTAAIYSPKLMKQAIPAASLAKSLVRIKEFSMDRLVTMMNGVPNQLIGQGVAMAMASIIMEDFKDGQKYYDASEQVIHNYLLKGANMADGTDFEQSFNYNADLPARITIIKNIYTPVANRPDFYKSLDDLKAYRQRMLTAVKNPLGTGPGVRNGGLEKTASPADKMVDEFQTVINGKKDSEMGFTSMAFPYGGYYVMRNKWVGEDAIHLFMKAARRGNGHMDEAGNGIQLTAYNRFMLYDGGSGNYSTQFQEKYVYSSFAHNTVVVDGYSQTMSANPPRNDAYDSTIPARWLTTDRFDFAEGFYNNGYGLINADNYSGQIKVTDTEHKRQVLYDKASGLFIVTDRMVSPAKHRYTQIWTLEPGFTYDKISVNPEKKYIRTIDRSGANISIYNFTNKQLDYRAYSGINENGTVLGWVNYHGEVVPKVDHHISWEGDGNQIMVSLLSPRAGLDEAVEYAKELGITENKLTAFEAELKNGTVIHYAAVLDAAKTFVLENVQMTGEALMLRTASDGRVTGIALGCRSMNLEGVPQEVKEKDFEFEIKDGRVQITDRITIPESFGWTAGEKGNMPVYTQSK